jgi:UDP-GlcNAc3NAcA epimerase
MPEEINRVITDHISEKLFAPTHAAVNHLEAEGIPADKVRMVGDVMYDVALQYGAIAEERSSILDRLNLRPKAYVLSTIHRAENTDDPERLKLLFEAIRHVSERVPVVLPLHPRTKCAVMAAGVPLAGSPGLIVTDPLGYLDMAMLERNASVIATDSGGVQKEAFFYQVPCVTLRLETEWAELIDLGWNRLATGASSVEIATSILGAVGTRGLAGSPYGSGRAACAIAADLTGMALNTESRSHEYPSH